MKTRVFLICFIAALTSCIYGQSGKEIIDLIINKVTNINVTQDKSFDYLIGGRGRGKTFSVQEYFTAKAVNDGIPFYWLRIYPKSIQKLTANNCSKFIDPIISRKYKLDLKM